jgi:hypothetical protein
MAGLVLTIHVFASGKQDAEARPETGHTGRENRGLRPLIGSEACLLENLGL